MPSPTHAAYTGNHHGYPVASDSTTHASCAVSDSVTLPLASVVPVARGEAAAGMYTPFRGAPTKSAVAYRATLRPEPTTAPGVRNSLKNWRLSDATSAQV